MFQNLSDKKIRILAYFFVAVQFIAIFIIIITAPFFCNNIWGGIVQLIGAGTGVWAILTMRLKKINITPIVRNDATLVDNGPYHFIRHPMYTAIFIATLPLIINYFDWFRLSLFAILFINLHFKSMMEEMLLMRKFTEYAEYRRGTKKFIPFIF